MMRNSGKHDREDKSGRDGLLSINAGKASHTFAYLLLLCGSILCNLLITAVFLTLS